MTVQRQLNFDDWMGILRRRKWQIIVPAILGTVGGLIVSFALPRQYTSHTRVMVEAPVVPSDIVKPVVSDDVSRQLASMQGEILSRNHLQSLIQDDHLYQKDWDRVPMEVLVARLQKSINVAPMAPTPGTMTSDVLGFNIDVTLDNAKIAQDVCTQIASMFKDENSSRREQVSESATQFLGNQLADAKSKLDDQDAKLAAFQNQYLGAQPEDQQTNISVLASLNPQLEAVTQDLNQAEATKAFAQSMLNSQLSALKSTNGSDPQNYQQQLTLLQDQLVQLRTRYTDKYPDVIKVQGEIADLQKKMQAPPSQAQAKAAPLDVANEPVQVQQLRAEVNQADTTITEKQKEQAQLQEQIKTIQARIQLSPTVQEQYSALTRDRQTAQDFYNNLLKEHDDAQMATDLEHRQESENFRILDPPSLPEAPSSPNRGLFALGGFLAGLAFGGGLMRFSEMRDKSLRQSRDVELFLGVPTLAVISSRDADVHGDVSLHMAPLFGKTTQDSRSLSAR